MDYSSVSLCKHTYIRYGKAWAGKKEGRKEMFYLTTDNTQHILSTVIWRQDHSDSEKGNPLPPHWLLCMWDGAYKRTLALNQ